MEEDHGPFKLPPLACAQPPLTPLSLSPMMSLLQDRAPRLPVTPPLTEADSQDDEALASAVHVLSIEATALSFLARLYQTDPVARSGFANAVAAISRSIARGGKLVVSGMGKSGKVGEKLVATLNSLGVLSVFVHPAEALHGDLGVIRELDAMLLITFSGRTAELGSLLCHLPPNIPVVAMTAHTVAASLPITRDRPDPIILPTPVPEPEEKSFGVAAPTTSTTVSMALGDALAIALSSRIHAREGRDPRQVFRSNHPGGAIGMR